MGGTLLVRTPARRRRPSAFAGADDPRRPRGGHGGSNRRGSDSSAARRQGDRHASRPATASARILVVDDEEAIRLICRVNLTHAGFETLEAADGDEALEIARREHPDLILLDVMMPTVDGWEVAGRLAADPETQDIAVVFLSARADVADKRRGYELGGIGYLTKPFDADNLVEWVSRTVARLRRGERDALRAEYEAELGRRR